MTAWRLAPPGEMEGKLTVRQLGDNLAVQGHLLVDLLGVVVDGDWNRIGTVSEKKKTQSPQGASHGPQRWSTVGGKKLTLKIELRVLGHGDVGVAGLAVGRVRAGGDAPLGGAGVAPARRLVGAPVEQGLDEVGLRDVRDVGLDADPDGDPEGLVGGVV